MSCNCSGDRFFARPISDRGVESINSCGGNRRNEVVRGDFDDRRGDFDDRRRCRCDSDCRCGGCGCHTCRCTAKSVIPGCCTGGVAGATLKDGLCQFVNRKVLIRVGCQTLCVVIAEVCDCVLKAICPKSGKVLYFNLDRIVDVQDIYS